jgi:hypothetical protein
LIEEAVGRLSGARLTLSPQRATAALGSACGGSQTTVPSIFERRADDLVQVDWLFLRTALA